MVFITNVFNYAQLIQLDYNFSLLKTLTNIPAPLKCFFISSAFSIAY